MCAALSVVYDMLAYQTQQMNGCTMELQLGGADHSGMTACVDRTWLGSKTSAPGHRYTMTTWISMSR